MVQNSWTTEVYGKKQRENARLCYRIQYKEQWRISDALDREMAGSDFYSRNITLAIRWKLAYIVRAKKKGGIRRYDIFLSS